MNFFNNLLDQREHGFMVPLSLALSLKGRGNLFRSLLLTRPRNNAHSVHPLPPGEGWGEGKINAYLPLILPFSRREKGTQQQSMCALFSGPLSNFGSKLNFERQSV